MADRYLLESGAPDGYLLEDGTGVLLLEAGLSGEDDGGWRGLQQALIGVVVAGAAALSANTAHAQRQQWQAEELPVQTASVSDPGGAYRARAVSGTTILRFSAQEDFPQAPPSALDETGWQPTAKAPAPVLGQLWETETPATWTFLQDDGWQPYQIASVTVAPLVFAADELPSTAPTLVEDGETPRANPAPIVLQAWGGDEELPVTPATPELDEQGPDLRTAIVAPVFPLPHQPDEWVPLAALDDSAWQPPDPWRTPIESIDLQAWDELPVTGSLPVDEHYWVPGVSLQPPAVAYVPGSEIEDIWTPAVDSSADPGGTWAQRAVSSTLILRIPTGDDLPQQAQPTVEESGYWPDWKAATVDGIIWAESDDIPQVSSAHLEESGYWPQPVPMPITAKVQIETETVETIVTLPIDDHYWQPGRSLEPAWIQYLPPFDETVVPQQLFVDEDGFQALQPPAPVINGIIWAEADDLPVAPVVPDEYYQAPTWIVPAPVLPLPYDGDEAWPTPPQPLTVDDPAVPGWLFQAYQPAPNLTVYTSDDEIGDFVAPPAPEQPAGGSYYQRRRIALRDAVRVVDAISIQRVVEVAPNVAQREFDFVILPPTLSDLALADSGKAWVSSAKVAKFAEIIEPLPLIRSRPPLIRGATR